MAGKGLEVQGGRYHAGRAPQGVEVRRRHVDPFGARAQAVGMAAHRERPGGHGGPEAVAPGEVAGNQVPGCGDPVAPHVPGGIRHDEVPVQRQAGARTAHQVGAACRVTPADLGHLGEQGLHLADTPHQLGELRGEQTGFLPGGIPEPLLLGAAQPAVPCGEDGECGEQGDDDGCGEPRCKGHRDPQAGIFPYRGCRCDRDFASGVCQAPRL